MGIDPVSHKPKNDTLSSNDGRSKGKTNLSHMAQWESARLEAEARLVKQSKIRSMSPLVNTVSSTVCSLTSAFDKPMRYLDEHKEIVHEECDDVQEYKDHKNGIEGFNDMITPAVDNTWTTQPLQSINNNDQHMPNENFLEHFTDLLLCSANTSDHCSFTKGDNSDIGLVWGDKFNRPIEDKNKNYWDNILNLMNSSTSSSLMF